MTETQFDIRKYFRKEPVLDKGHVEFIDGMVTEPMLKVVNSARVSFLRQADALRDKDKKLIKFLVNHEHFSTLRHSYFSFRIKAPLCVFRQWWKYQIGSEWVEGDETGVVKIPETNWNEASFRYIKSEPEFYIPNEIRQQSEDNKQGSHGKLEKLKETDLEPVKFFEASCIRQYNDYLLLVENGAAKEQARMLLPQNVYSECIWTCSLQTIVFFLHQRLKDDAQEEIREYAKAVHKLVSPLLLDGMVK